MAPALKSIVFENIRDHHSNFITERLWQTKDDKPLEYTPNTAAMIRDWEEVCEVRGKRYGEKHQKVIEEKMADVDGMPDEELSCINISTLLSKESEAQDLIKGDVEDEKRDPSLTSTNTINMCGDGDYSLTLMVAMRSGSSLIRLFSNRQILSIYATCAGISTSKLLRTRIIHDGIFSYDHPEEWDSEGFSLNVLDDGPDYALRLEIEFTDQGQPKKRLVIHSINQESGQLQPLHGLMVQKDTADMSRLRGWLHACNESHQLQGLASAEYLSPLPDRLRVIDTAENYITEVDMPCEYICLSYVSGTGSQTQYTTETRDQLSKPGGLDSANLPQTIVDAIQVTRQLGVRYIWVDTLCITQDDSDDKAKIIFKMANIYANATLSIMASSNVDPTDGLPGVGVLEQITNISQPYKESHWLSPSKTRDSDTLT
ncbi:hypothetical protein FGRMN_4731 [Fusarium graminum]|nr:hypothetical protein FGRMN_4731 [Fusarium graminum]